MSNKMRMIGLCACLALAVVTAHATQAKNGDIKAYIRDAKPAQLLAYSFSDPFRGMMPIWLDLLQGTGMESSMPFWPRQPCSAWRSHS